MIQTPEQERAYWDAADPAVEVWGIEAHGDGVDACLAEIELALQSVPADGRILDLGCGPGRLLIPLSRRRPVINLWGVDISTEMTALCRRLSGGRVWSITTDGRTLPMGDAFFHAAYSVGLLQHLPHDAVRGYIVELARVLRPGGRVRLQHVIGTEDSFMSHQCTEAQLVGWCEDAGLVVTAVDVGRVHYQWVWISAARP